MLAINKLKDGTHSSNQVALKLLQKSEQLAENNEHGMAMTFNNYACYYRKLGRPRIALKYLEQALEIESR